MQVRWVILFSDSAVCFFTLEWKITFVCVRAKTHMGWFICFYDCSDSRVQSCAERPKDMQECTCLHTNPHSLTHSITHTHTRDTYTHETHTHNQATFSHPIFSLSQNWWYHKYLPTLVFSQIHTHKQSFSLSHTQTNTHWLNCWCYKKRAVFNLSLKLYRQPKTHTNAHTQCCNCGPLCSLYYILQCLCLEMTALSGRVPYVCGEDVNCQRVY